MIKLIVVGKMNHKYLNEGISYYKKQLPVDLDIIEVKDEKNIEGMKLEGQYILSKIKESDVVVVLAINGKILDSIGFSKMIEDVNTYQQGDLVFVIGGSYGLSPEVYQRANQKISFSKMTFPHQLMRLILVEQIYRGFMIMKNHPYHK
ncbi:23S rRNA (pseudouridine(1915)-N(3))-methyltransferase RlmH [Mariniplasma anaerobium]|uniref:Ribosomal RNA large subunit methyltransferase H n=1 Tax=Mariniplasma anaerobium TaxID=2735436 RepID=A0A7U9XXG8_9MOLU|nr:23S rRNA (pseudouridine(1915)-N(3))-methyltransferase RlmH [Mariniplasma anaerobium]BCR35459.1 ribosomal RNA large subunit methyltransferase H [Mariniplasma anaerobium]